ncbi:DNA-binding LacI/PurR family transcriptional regulator [Pseudomonas psychrotolerans]|nr:DNA-binding LacI/PurR family transcriptional regulator [Pseudomonas psychrotolerans]
MAPGGKKKATIYDLSQLSGSSASTVSAVLNGSWRKRRIKEATAQLIQSLAEEHGYSTNLQARGLRQSRSGLVGLMLPLYDNRFFSALAQGFEARVRARGLCPLVVSGCRDPELERSTVESLLAYSIDELFIAGATDPDSIHRACERAGVRHLNLDLPGTLATSVTSDNYVGAFELTQAILGELASRPDLVAEDLCLFGGYSDYASRERMRGFVAAKRAHFGSSASEDVFSAAGYSPALTHQALGKLHPAPGATAPGGLHQLHHQSGRSAGRAAAAVGRGAQRLGGGLFRLRPLRLLPALPDLHDAAERRPYPGPRLHPDGSARSHGAPAQGSASAGTTAHGPAQPAGSSCQRCDVGPANCTGRNTLIAAAAAARASR